MKWGLEHWASGMQTVGAPQTQAASLTNFTTAPTHVLLPEASKVKCSQGL